MNKLARTLAWVAAGALTGAGLAKLQKMRAKRQEEARELRFGGTRTLETPRLILRRFTLDDAADMYENWARDPEVTRFLTWQPHEDEDATYNLLEGWVDQYEKGNYYNWAIELKELGEPIGNISVVAQNEKVRQAHIGYCLGREWWHQGIMTEALRAVIPYLFQEGYLRIDSRHNVDNPHSGGVMKKAGMRYEGTLRQNGWDNSGVHDEALYAILAEEYEGSEGGI